MKYVEYKDAIAYNTYDSGWKHEWILDNNSFSIDLDNRWSGCISHEVEDFVGPLKDCHRVIKWLKGTNTTDVKIGTIKWSRLDYTGSDQETRIPNSYVIPSGEVCLLISQHWAQTQGGKFYETRGLGEETTFDRVVLLWNRRKSQLTIPLKK